jgi:hypothetical protein
LLSSLLVLKGEAEPLVLGLESCHELRFLGFRKTSEVLFGQLSLSLSEAPPELGSLVLGSCVSLSLSFEELFVIFDLVLELMVKRADDVSLLGLCSPLSLFLLQLLGRCEGLSGLLVQAALLFCFLLAKELTLQASVYVHQTSLEGHLLVNMLLV